MSLRSTPLPVRMAALAVTALTLISAQAFAAVDDEVRQVQSEWETIRYQTPPAERVNRFAALASKAHGVSEAFPNRSEPLIWEGIVVSSLAGEKGGLGALGLVKQAKALYETAIQIDGAALDGSAYNSLGVLYYKVPGWPVGFGDKAKARELLLKSLQLNPNGIDPNYFYAEFLVETQQADKALPYLDKVLAAPDRPGRQVADAGRRDEARQLIEKIKSSR